MGEGKIEDDEVICPWHGSRFNLKTGAVLEPPARQGVKSFAVQVTADDVEALRSAGIADQEIFHATAFVALRLAFSTVNDPLGARFR